MCSTASPPISRRSWTTSPAGAPQWKDVLRDFWMDFSRLHQPANDQDGTMPSMDDAVSFLDSGIGKRSVVIDVLNEILAPHFFPPTEDGRDTAHLPGLQERPARHQARQDRRLHRLQQLSGMPLHPPARGRERRGERAGRPARARRRSEERQEGDAAQGPVRPLRAAGRRAATRSRSASRCRAAWRWTR